MLQHPSAQGTEMLVSKGVESTVGFIHLPPGHSPTGPASLGSSRESGEEGKMTDQFDMSARDHLDCEIFPAGSKDTP